MEQKEPGPVTRLTRRYTAAVDEARIIHGADVRKGTTIPYFSHVLFVSAIVLEYGGSEQQAIAALLHDAAEDNGGHGRLDVIRAEFGDTIADLVLGLSDSLTKSKDDKDPWLKRKKAYLERLATESTDVLLVSAADKLANLTSTRADYRRLGPELWSRFNAPRSAQLWYSEQLSGVYTEKLREGRAAELAAELAAQVEEFQLEVRDRENVKRKTLVAEFEAFSRKSK